MLDWFWRLRARALQRLAIARMDSLFSDVVQLNIEDLDKKLSETGNVRLFDVRRVDEFQVSHIPGASQVDPDISDEDLVQLTLDGEEFVCYCSIGYRSSLLARRISNIPGKKGLNLRGSIFKYGTDGGKLVNDHGDHVTKIHPYESKYASLLQTELVHSS